MIATSRPMKLAALMIAGSAHAALALALLSSDPVEVEGAAGGADVCGNCGAPRPKSGFTGKLA